MTATQSFRELTYTMRPQDPHTARARDFDLRPETTAAMIPTFDLVCLSFEFSIATVQVVDNHATRYCHTAQAAA